MRRRYELRGGRETARHSGWLARTTVVINSVKPLEYQDEYRVLEQNLLFHIKAVHT